MSNSSLLFMLIISVISGIYFFWGGGRGIISLACL